MNSPTSSPRGASSVIGTVILMGIVIVYGMVVGYLILSMSLPTTHPGDVSITQESNGEISVTATNMGNAEYLQIEVINNGGAERYILNESQQAVTLDAVGPNSTIRIYSEHGETKELIREYQPIDVNHDVTVDVIDAQTGMPISDSKISLDNDGPRDGPRATFEVEDGTYTVSATADNYANETEQVTVDGGSEYVTVALGPEKHTLRTNVVDSNGNPLPNATIFFRGLSYSGPTETFTDLSDGAYTVSADANGFNSASKTVTIDSADEAVTIVLAAKSTVPGSCPDPNNWRADWDSGSEPYAVCTVEQLQDIENYDSSASYVQQQDIDASKTTGWNSGAGFEPIDQFNGEYNGNNYKIDGLVIDRPNRNNVGLFGEHVRGDIKHVHLTNAGVYGQKSVGGVVGEMDAGYMHDVHVTNSKITSAAEIVGGVIGGIDDTNGNTIKNISSSGTVEAEITNDWGYAGGAIGHAWSGSETTIINAHSSADVITHDYKAGGLIAWVGPGIKVRDSSATGDVTANTGGWAGGLAAGADGVIRNSYATGDVTAKYGVVGGFIGSARGRKGGADITDVYARGAVKSTSGYDVGGLIGELEPKNGDYPAVRRAYSTGTVSGEGEVGGLVGAGSGTVSDSYWDTSASGVSTSEYGTGLSTGQMKGTDSRNHMFDDFSQWKTQPGEYPKLKWEE